MWRRWSLFGMMGAMVGSACAHATHATPVEGPAPTAPVSRVASGDADQDLARMICAGDLSALVQRLDAGVAPDTVVGDCTLLQAAVSCEQVPAAKLLLDRGAKASERGPKGVPPLHMASMTASAALVELLLERGAAVSELTLDEQQPLHFAAMGARPDVIELLVARGAAPNARDRSGMSPLAYALVGDEPATLRALLNGGADPLLSVHDRPLVESASSVASYELLRDAAWKRRPETPIAVPPLLMVALLDEKRSDAAACYARAHPQPAGTNLSLKLTLEPDGHVTRVEWLNGSGEVSEPSVVECVVGVVSRLRFPRASKGASFIHTFELASP